MSKKIASKLDQYAEQLQAMETEGQTLLAMQAWLKEEGVIVAQSTIGRFLECLRGEQAQERVLQMVVTGSQQCAELDKAYASNPAPEMELLVKLFKTLVMQLTVKGSADPKMLTMAMKVSDRCLKFISGRTMAEFKKTELAQAERKLQLAEKRAAQAEDTEKVLDDSKLSAAQREEKIKEIYGRA